MILCQRERKSMSYCTNTKSISAMWRAHYYITVEYVLLYYEPWGNLCCTKWTKMIVLLCAGQMNTVMQAEIGWGCKPYRLFQKVKENFKN